MRSSKEGVEAGVSRVPKARRRWPMQEKRRIVEETLLPDSSIAQVARTHAVNANQVHLWRRLYERGLLTSAETAATLLPVRVIKEEESLPMVRAAVPQQAARRSVRPVGVIQIEVERGRLRVEGQADPAALRVVLECLLR